MLPGTPGKREVSCKKVETIFPKKLFLVLGYVLIERTNEIFSHMQFDCDVCELFHEQRDCHCTPHTPSDLIKDLQRL